VDEVERKIVVKKRRSFIVGGDQTLNAGSKVSLAFDTTGKGGKKVNKT
jgi:hypothetical protein